MSNITGAFPPGSPRSDDEATSQLLHETRTRESTVAGLSSQEQEQQPEPKKGKSVADLGKWTDWHLQKQSDFNQSMRAEVLDQRKDIKRILDMVTALQPRPRLSPAQLSAQPSGPSALVPVPPLAESTPLPSSPQTATPPTATATPPADAATRPPAAMTSDERYQQSLLREQQAHQRQREQPAQQPGQQREQPQPGQLIVFPYVEEGTGDQYAHQERGHRLRINFDCPQHVPHDASFDVSTEALVKNVWPRAKAAREVDEEVCNNRNKVILKPEWKLHRADHTVLQKLQLIQSALVVGQIPYNLWPARMVNELSGDFGHVACWVDVRHPSWLLLLEGIFTVLRDHGALDAPLAIYAQLAPVKDEALLNFAWRIRDAFLNLPDIEKRSAGVRKITIQHLRNNLPRIWAQLSLNIATLHGTALIERLVLLAGEQARWPVEDIYGKPSASIRTQEASPYQTWRVNEAIGNKPATMEMVKPSLSQLSASTLSAPPGIVIADPRTTDITVHPADDAASSSFAATSQGNTCFNCGKPGHWAKDCRLLSTPAPAYGGSGNASSSSSSAPGRDIKITGKLYEAAKAFGSRWRNRGNTSTGRGRAQRGGDRGRGGRGSHRGNSGLMCGLANLELLLAYLAIASGPAGREEDDSLERHAARAAQEFLLFLLLVLHHS